MAFCCMERSHIWFTIHPRMNIWVASTSWLLWLELLWTGVCKYPFEILLSIPLHTYPEVGLLDHMVVLSMNIHTVSHNCCTILQFHQQFTSVPNCTHSCHFILFFGCSAGEILVLCPGIKPVPLHWKRRVLTTEPSGKSLHPRHFILFFFNRPPSSL